MSRAISEQEFKDWLTHPVTLAVKEVLAEKREILRRQWESGAFTDYDNTAMGLVNVGNIGTCRGYAFVQELDYETYLSELEDEQPIGPGASGSRSIGEAL